MEILKFSVEMLQEWSRQLRFLHPEWSIAQKFPTRRILACIAALDIHQETPCRVKQRDSASLQC